MASLSVTDPIDKAWRRMVLICFKPFDIGKWFALGFCAFLAYLGEGGGGGGSGYHFPGTGAGGTRGAGGSAAPMPWSGAGGPEASPPRDILHQGLTWIDAHLVIVVLIVAVALVVGLALLVLLQWLRARGEFMFLDGIARNGRTQLVRGPWKEYRREANSLFVFMVILSLIVGVVGLLAVGLCVGIAWPDLMAWQFGNHAASAILAAVLLLPVVSIGSAVLFACIHDFVVPIMYLRRCSFAPAWQEFWNRVVPGNVGTIILFFLMQMLLVIAALIVSGMATCLTCCLAALPYLGTVILLPVYVFLRTYPLAFLEQLGPDYKILSEPEPPSYGFPVIIPPPAPSPAPEQPPTPRQPQ